MRIEFNTLIDGLRKSFLVNGPRPAIEVGERTYTYREVEEAANLVAGAISELKEPAGDFVGIFGYRSFYAYAGILGALLSGQAYMPLNPGFPTERLRQMISLSSCNTIILGEECAEAFSQLGKEAENLIVICPDPGEGCRRVAEKMATRGFIFPEELSGGQKGGVENVSPEAPAYLLFTSGSTGVPKGVAITHDNVSSYVRYTIERYQVGSKDRLSQMFDLTFDLSVHDVFVSLLSGACLCVVPELSVMAPAKFIKEKELTLWFSVPSVAMFMSRMRMLKPDSFRTLRYSLFCGEALPMRSAQSWQAAAANSIVENLYGPTEATISITNYRWDSEKSPGQCVNGVVPIGRPFDDHRVRVVGEGGRELGVDEQGEMYLAGPQVAGSYLNNPDMTRESFVQFEDAPGITWYRTGDLVRRDADGCLYFLGRIDDQVQIRGYRVELQEIDKVLREGAGTDLAICVPRYVESGQVEALYGFIQGSESDFSVEEILDYCKKLLPKYMVPAKLNFLKELPKNSSGKISRKTMIQEICR